MEIIIIPWLLKKKASMDLSPDHPAILIVDCWYGWLDAGFKKWIADTYPWIRLLFVPASCTSS